MYEFSNYKTVQIPIGGRVYTLYVADDREKRQKGLAGVPYIPTNEGMLFKHKTSVRNPYTMQDMKVPLRVIFLDEEFQVVGEFDTKPGQKEEVCPEADFMYVIEILKQ